jgi:hypothetical protein
MHGWMDAYVATTTTIIIITIATIIIITISTIMTIPISTIMTIPIKRECKFANVCECYVLFFFSYSL